MVKYYRLDEQKVIDTVTEIPQEMWERKQLLPYELVWVEISDLEVLPENTFEILSDKVLETKYTSIHIPTLDELKANKIELLKSSTLNYTYEKVPQYKREQIFSQLSGVDWGLNVEDINKVNNWLKQHKTEVDLIEIDILNCVSKEELDLLPNEVKIEW